MTVSNSYSNTTAVKVNGLVISREMVPALAERLAEDLFYLTKQDPYKHLPDKSAKRDLAHTIGYYLHVILNQTGVDSRDCVCGQSQQEHDCFDGSCPEQTKGSRFTPKP